MINIYEPLNALEEKLEIKFIYVHEGINYMDYNHQEHEYALWCLPRDILNKSYIKIYLENNQDIINGLGIVTNDELNRKTHMPKCETVRQTILNGNELSVFNKKNQNQIKLNYEKYVGRSYVFPNIDKIFL